MMKKILTPILVFLVVGLAYWYWPGQHPDLPKSEEVATLVISTYPATEMVWLDQEEVDKLLTSLKKSKQSRLPSHSDNPLQENYVQLDWALKNGEAKRLYLYKGWLNTYLEIPYQGVYRVSNDLPEMIAH